MFLRLDKNQHDVMLTPQDVCKTQVTGTECV